MPRPITPLEILAATLAEICDEWGGLDARLIERLRSARDLATGLDPYLGACSSPESPELSALAARTAAVDWRHRNGAAVALEQEMLSGHVEGRLLRFLVRSTRARRVLELGMFTGYSALALAEALPPGGRVVACELDPEVAAFAAGALAASEAGARVEVIVGPAAAALQRLAAAGERFDFVFIDADKAGYLGYVRSLLDDGLLAPDGVICVDNTLLQGEPYLPGPRSANGEAIRAFNAAIAADPRIEQVLLPVRDGITLIRRVAP